MILKGVLLVSAAIGALRLLHKDVAEVVERWVDALRVDPDNRYVQAILLKVGNRKWPHVERNQCGHVLLCRGVLNRRRGTVLAQTLGRIDLLKLWRDYNVALGMLYVGNLLPEIMKQTAEDALRGDKDALRLVFEIAGLIGRNRAAVVAIQQNCGVNLEDNMNEVSKILMKPDP